MECKLHNTARQDSAEVSRSASFSKLRESLRRSSVRLFNRLAGRHSANLPPDVDYTDPESMKRASSLSALSNSPPNLSHQQDQR